MTHKPFVPPDDPSERTRFLVNKLTVADARRLLKLEGVELDGRSFAREIAFAVAFAATTAYAIATGGVTIWHLFMPLVASWFGLVTAIPVVYLIYRHPAIKVEAKKAIGNLAVAAVVGLGVVFVHTRNTGQPFSTQFVVDATAAWRWVIDAGIHWAMLVAYFNIVSSMPSRVNNLLEFGPPFAAVGLGCALQMLLLIGGAIALPFLIGYTHALVWWLWAILVLANVLSIYAHWDVGVRLKKYDAVRRAEKRTDGAGR